MLLDYDFTGIMQITLSTTVATQCYVSNPRNYDGYGIKARVYWGYSVSTEFYCIVQALPDTTKKPRVYCNYLRV